MLLSLLLLEMRIADARGRRGALAPLRPGLDALPDAVRRAVAGAPAVKDVAREVHRAQNMLYLGRGPDHATAVEGALKMKEISYIHAEGYAAGEMKHGPIALIDDKVPVIVAAPTDAVFEKVASNVQEVSARGGRVILFSDAKGVKKIGNRAETAITLPDCDPFVAPILYAIPVQLLAYHAAVAKGTDVDQPRNLAKAVTVE